MRVRLSLHADIVTNTVPWTAFIRAVVFAPQESDSGLEWDFCFLKVDDEHKLRFRFQVADLARGCGF